MKAFNFSFVWIIVASGFMSLLFIIANLASLGFHRFPSEPRQYVAEGDVKAGKFALERYGCGSCHVIPGIRTATGRVGPSLAGIDQQVFIAGVVANTPTNLLLWIRHPQNVDPRTVMPDLNVSEEDARHMVAYLYNPDRPFWERWTN